MNNPMHNLFKSFRNHYYYQELVQLSSIAAIAVLAWVTYLLAGFAAALAGTEKGLLWILAFAVGLVLALSIKLFYNILMIKYSKNPFEYKLFEDLAKKD